MPNQRTLDVSFLTQNAYARLLKRGLAGDYSLAAMLTIALLAGPVVPPLTFVASYWLLTWIGEPLALLTFPLGLLVFVFAWPITACFFNGAFKKTRGLQREITTSGAVLGALLVAPVLYSVAAWFPIAYGSSPGQPISPGPSPSYFARRGHVVYSSSGNCMVSCDTIAGANPKAFKQIGKHFAVAAERVYCEERILSGERPADFHVLRGDYARGRLGVYFLCKRLPAEAQSFEVHEFTFESKREHFGLDAKHIYCEGAQLGPRAPDFGPLEHDGYYANGTSVYEMSRCRRISDDRATFAFVRHTDGTFTSVARDAHHVISIFSDFANADPNSFRFPCSGEHKDEYAVDAQHVFRWTRVIPGAHPSTFPFPSDCDLGK
jgi:hypothetical protein